MMRSTKLPGDTRALKPSERAIGQIKVGTKAIVKYSAGVALQICEEVAQGKTVVEICKSDWAPSRNSLYRWLTVYPDFAKAYERAYEISAEALEEEALKLARELQKQEDFTGTRVQAYNVAMQQLRWSASRRNPKKFGQKAESNVVVPVQINTTLDLGEGSQKVGYGGGNLYSMASVVKQERPDDTTPEDELEVFDGEGAEVYNVPAEQVQSLKRAPGPKVGTAQTRVGKGHKSVSRTKAQEKVVAKRTRKNNGK